MDLLNKKNFCILCILFFCAFLCAQKSGGAEDKENAGVGEAENAAALLPAEAESAAAVLPAEAETAPGPDVEDGEAGEEVLSEKEEIEKSYRSFVDYSGKIRLSESEAGFFSAAHNPEGKRQLVSSYGKKFQRRFYDDDIRLKEIEYWSMESGSASARLEKRVEFKRPDEKIKYDSILENDFLNKKQTLSVYYSPGILKSRRVDFLDDEKNIVSFEILTFLYDASGNVLREEMQSYIVDGKSTRLKKSRLNENRYSGGKLTESSYYENSVLRLRTYYDDREAGTYVQTTYFDGGFIVRDFYRGGVKIYTSLK